MTYTLHYRRYYGKYTEEYETVLDAVRSAEFQEEMGEIYADRLTEGDAVVLDHDALRSAIHDLPEADKIR